MTNRSISDRIASELHPTEASPAFLVSIQFSLSFFVLKNVICLAPLNSVFKVDIFLSRETCVENFAGYFGALVSKGEYVRNRSYLHL